jgi:RNA polymerase sigma-70 factor (ECF subfamily)
MQLSDLEDDGYALVSHEAQPEQAAATRQMRQMMYEALAQLPPELRQVYQMRDVDEMSGEEVAEKLGITVPAMKSRLHRARSALRERIEAALTGDSNKQTQ